VGASARSQPVNVCGRRGELSEAASDSMKWFRIENGDHRQRAMRGARVSAQADFHVPIYGTSLCWIFLLSKWCLIFTESTLTI
jgi:hypothetical protein